VTEVGLFKTLVAGEPSTLNKKHEDFYEVVIDKPWIFITNIKPTFIDPTHKDYIEGMDKRFELVEADVPYWEAGNTPNTDFQHHRGPHSSGVGSSIVSSYVSKTSYATEFILDKAEREKEQRHRVKRASIDFNSEKQRKKEQENRRLKELQEQHNQVQMKLIYREARLRGNCEFICFT
jgi:hypothetical protein